MQSDTPIGHEKHKEPPLRSLRLLQRIVTRLLRDLNHYGCTEFEDDLLIDHETDLFGRINCNLVGTQHRHGLRLSTVFQRECRSRSLRPPIVYSRRELIDVF